MGDSLTLTNAVWYTVRKDIFFVLVSEVSSLFQEGLGERVIKCLVVCVLNVDIVVNLTNEDAHAVI